MLTGVSRVYRAAHISRVRVPRALETLETLTNIIDPPVCKGHSVTGGLGLGLGIEEKKLITPKMKLKF